MGDQFTESGTQAETAAETDPAASPRTLPLPEGVQPVERVPGYHALIKGGAVTVFGPDGAEIASARRASGYGSAIAGRVGDTRLVADGLGRPARSAARRTGESFCTACVGPASRSGTGMHAREHVTPRISGSAPQTTTSPHPATHTVGGRASPRPARSPPGGLRPPGGDRRGQPRIWIRTPPLVAGAADQEARPAEAAPPPDAAVDEVRRAAEETGCAHHARTCTRSHNEINERRARR